jgi:hypothetical protein
VTTDRTDPAATSPAVTNQSAPATPEEIQSGGTMAPDEDSLPDADPSGGNGAPVVPDASAAPATPAAGETPPSTPTTPAPSSPEAPTGDGGGATPPTG